MLIALLVAIAFAPCAVQTVARGRAEDDHWREHHHHHRQVVGSGRILEAPWRRTCSSTPVPGCAYTLAIPGISARRSHRPSERAAARGRLQTAWTSIRPLVAGVDVSVKNNRSQRRHRGGDLSGFRARRDRDRPSAPTPFPYIPGLLSFREGPVLQEAFEKLQAEPDVFLFDGMGIAHPRRVGIASHMGLWLRRRPSAAARPCSAAATGTWARKRAPAAPLIDKGETIGVALRTRTAKNPMFISPGHLADIPSAAELVLRCSPKYRLPEPIRLATTRPGSSRPDPTATRACGHDARGSRSKPLGHRRPHAPEPATSAAWLC